MPGVSTTTVGSCGGRRRAGAQGLEQQVGVVGDRRDAVLREQLGEEPHHHLAVLQHVAHAAGHPQVVFEHVVLAVAVGVGRAHDVDARRCASRRRSGTSTPIISGRNCALSQDLLGRDRCRP